MSLLVYPYAFENQGEVDGGVCSNRDTSHHFQHLLAQELPTDGRVIMITMTAVVGDMSNHINTHQALNQMKIQAGDPRDVMHLNPTTSPATPERGADVMVPGIVEKDVNQPVHRIIVDIAT